MTGTGVDGSTEARKGSGPKHKRRGRLVLAEGTMIIKQSLSSSSYDYMTDGQDAPP